MTATATETTKPAKGRRRHLKLAPDADARLFTFKAKADEFVRALKGISVFAGSDWTLPALTGVQCEVTDDDKVTLIASDRYMLGIQTVPAENVDGSGKVLFGKGLIKALLAAKPEPHQALTLTVTGRDVPRGVLTVETADIITGGTRAEYALPMEQQLPEFRGIFAKWKPAPASARPASVEFDPKRLAQLAKVPVPKLTPVKLTPGKAGGPVKFEVGDVTGLIMVMRTS